MSEAQLSQDEIDALLDGVPPEVAEAPAWNARGLSGRGVANGVGAVTGSFDVANAGRFNNGHLPTLALVNERFIELFDKALQQFTGRPAKVTAEATTITKYAAFTAELATPSSLNIVRMGPSLGNALFVFDSGLLYFVIDSLFGGSGSMSATKGGRHFTTTEQRLIGRLCEIVFTNYAKAWEPVHPMQFELLRSESETRFVNLVSPDDGVLAYGFSIESGTSRGRFQICMPLDGIDPIRDVIMREVREKTTTSDARWSERLAAQVAAAEIELVANLASVPVTCKELLEMKVGDVILLDIKPSIVACADGIPVLRCRYGNSDGRYAIRVEEVIVPSSGN
jgi:flagellar motor switch protein FliM